MTGDRIGCVDNHRRKDGTGDDGKQAHGHGGRRCGAPAGTGRIEAFEALIRWNHPALGLLSPSEFLPALDRSAQMAAVGRWILEEACHSAAGWGRLGHEEVGVHINVSEVQLEDDRFVGEVRNALAATSLSAHRLTLEVLELAPGLDRGGP